MKQAALHEDLRREVPAATSSNRAFGLVFTVFFTVVALWPLRSGGPIRSWAAVFATCFFLPSLFRPSLLAGLNRWWTRFGLLLARVVHPIVISILFFGVFTPIGFLMRRFSGDPMRRGFEPDATTYWISCTPPGPMSASMRKQF
jgi:hypothetical protein